MSSGYIKLHRQLQRWEWYTAPNHVHIFVHLLISANHKDGRWRGHDYKRGDVLTSLGKIASDTGLSVRNVRTVLKNLESTGEITKSVTSQLTHLTLCNYDIYQSSEFEGDKPTDKRPTSDRQAGDNKQERKNEKNEKNRYGEHKNILLTADEYNRLVEGWGPMNRKYTDYGRKWAIEKLSAYLASTGKRYRSHYATLQGWVFNDWVKFNNGREKGQKL